MKASDIFNSTNYQAKLQRPEWKVFSARVRKHHKNACEMCKRTNLETNVHHPFYESDREPWQYQISEVVLLCRGCHEQMHDQLKLFRKFIFKKLNVQTFKVLNSALSVAVEKYDALAVLHAFSKLVSDAKAVERFASDWGGTSKKLTEEEIAFLKFKRSMTGKIDVRI